MITKSGNKFIRWFRLLSIGWFGAEKGTYKMERRNWVTYLITNLVIACILLARKPDSLFQAQFFAEDGSFFFAQQITMGFWKSLFFFPAGFPYWIHRLIALIAVPFGYANAPLVYVLLTLLIVSTASACFSLPHFRHIITNDYLRVLVCVAIAILPGSQILVGVMSNIAWYLGIWALLSCFMQFPVSRWGRALFLLIYLLTIYSSPIAILALPIWIVRIMSLPIRYKHDERVICFVLLFGYASVFLISRNLGANSSSNFLPSIGAFFNLINTRLILAALVGNDSALQAANSSFAYFFTYGSAFVLIILLVGLSLSARFKNIPALLISAYLMNASIALLLLGRAQWSLQWDQLNSKLTFPSDTGRYFVVGILAVYLMLIIGIDRLKNPIRPIATGMLVFILIGVAVQSFKIPAYQDQHWQDYVGEIQPHIDSKEFKPLIIPLNPPSWSLYFDTRSFAPEVRFDPSNPQPGGDLVGSTVVSQTFTSECAKLSWIDVVTAKDSNIKGQKPVNFWLEDLTMGQIVVRQTFLPQQLFEDDWLVNYFKALPESQNHQYRFNLSSPQSEALYSIKLLSNTSDQYKAGEAYIDGKVLNTDLMFRYGCQP